MTGRRRRGHPWTLAALAALPLLLGACDARSFWGRHFLGDADPQCAEAPETCSACRSDADCREARPVCDSAAGRCRGCTSNDECASGVCLLEPWPGDTLGAGACAPVTRVCRVDPYRCGASRDGTLERPYCEVNEAVDGCSGPYLAVAAQAPGLRYRTELTVAGKPLAVTSIGKGQPVLPAVTVRGAGALLLLSSVIVDHGNTPGNALTCRDGARLRLRQIQARGGDVGVMADNGCLELDLSRGLVEGNDLDGISIATGMTRYRIVNSIIARNGRNAQALAGGVSIGRGALGTFAFNTVVYNGVIQSGVSGGVVCLTAAQLTDSIIEGNSFSSQSRSQVDSSCTLSRVALGAEGSSRPGTLPGAVSLESDYRLKEGSACCIDRAQADLVLAVDYFGNRRPQRGGYDVGAHELP